MMIAVPPQTRIALIAPDKFKGTLTAAEVAGAIASGLGGDSDLCPLADGGDGTAAVLLEALGGEWVAAAAHDALGEPVEAGFALLDDGRTAAVEVAAASGIGRLDPARLDPLGADSGGTGELIAAAIAAGASLQYERHGHRRGHWHADVEPHGHDHQRWRSYLGIGRPPRFQPFDFLARHPYA